MAKILPLKAWRYHDEYKAQIEELTSPLFDVVSAAQREALYANPLNSIHLSVPLGKEPANQALRILNQWKTDETIVQDRIPGIYVYYQYFKLPGSEEEICRKGFIAQIFAYDWEDKVVLRHENTIVNAVNDRFELLAATEFQPSPTHGLYEDPNYHLEPYMDAAIKNPIYELEDYQGVREVLGVIHDASIVQKFIHLIDKKMIVLADGHHRYEGAINFRKERAALNPNHSGKEGYNYHMMYFTNASSPNLKILPTHRIFYGVSITEQTLLGEIEKYFTIKKLNDTDEIEGMILQKKWAFGLIIGEHVYKIILKPECIHQMPQQLEKEVKELDLMILHYFLVEKVLGIGLEEQRFSEKIAYERNLNKCIQQVNSGKASFALITKELNMKQILEVCKSGAIMPQKSTYFYPKALSGLLFASIKEEEFNFPFEVFD
jgi:uncharacterized protein (DUF1015 family)